MRQIIMGILLFPFLTLLIAKSSVASLNANSLEGLLLIGTDKALHTFDANGKPLEVVAKFGAQSIDYDCSTNEIVWSNLGDLDVNEVYIQGDKLTTLPKPEGTWVPKSVAVDSINHKIYVSENYYNSVLLYDRVSGEHKVIHKVDRPTRYFNWQLALDAKEGYLFIQSDYEVIRTDLNGAHAKVIYCEIEGSEHESKPMNMTRFTIDTQSKRLFWINPDIGQVSSMNYDGQEKKAHFERSSPEANVFDSLTVLNGILYWADFDNSKLTKVVLNDRDPGVVYNLNSVEPESIKGIHCSP